MSGSTNRHIVRVEGCDRDIVRQLRGALRGRAVVVTARPADRQFGRISTLGSDLLTALGHLGTGTASRPVENDLQRVLPFLATADQRDVIIRNATHLKTEGINAISLLCAAAAVRLWLLEDSGASTAVKELLSAKAGRAVTQTQMLATFGLTLTAARRRRPQAQTLSDVVVDLAAHAGTPPPALCDDCASTPLGHANSSVHLDDPWQAVLTRAAAVCTGDQACTPQLALLLFDVGVLSRYGLHLWMRPGQCSHADGWHRDALRPALVALRQLSRQHGINVTPALLKGLRVQDMAPDASNMRLAGQCLDIPGPLRLPLLRQRLTAELRTATGAERLLCFANQDINDNVWRSLASL